MVWQSVSLIWLSGLIFGLFHSLTASQSCKQWCYRHSLQEPYYRLAYSILAVASTVVWVVFIRHLDDAPLYQMQGVLWVGLVVLQILGFLIAIAALQPIDGLVFLGLKKAKTGHDPFVVRGIYRWLRHPMYSGAMLFLLAAPEQSWNGLHFTLVICVYFVIGSRYEEARMLAEHPSYADYRRRVSAFIPW